MADTDDSKIMGFFNEDHESRSMMRLMCYQSWWASAALAIGTVILGIMKQDLAAQQGMILTGMFLGTAFTGKIIQKYAEAK